MNPPTRRQVAHPAEWDLLQSYGDAAEVALSPAGAPSLPTETPTLADVVTLTGFGLGLWWAQGGPSWAGVASLLADEVDGRLARAMGTASAHGSLLDWGGDVALTPFALARLGRETGHERASFWAAPPVLLGQTMLRARGYRPSVGSARAVVTLAAIVAHELRTR